MRTLKVGSTEWLVELWWQTLGNQKDAIKEARKLAETLESSERYNCFVPRILRHLTPQAGFGVFDGKHRLPALGSLAAAVADARPSSWIGWFQFKTGVWVVAVLDGLIIPEGDFFGTVEEAEAKLQDFEQFGDWSDTLICRTPEETEQTLRELLKKPKKVTKLRPVTQETFRALWIFGCFLALSVTAAGMSWYVSHQREATELASKLNSAALKTVQPILKKPEVAKAPPAELRLVPTSATVQTCARFFDALEVSESGWALQTWTCSGLGESEVVRRKTKRASVDSLPADSGFNVAAPETWTKVVKSPTLPVSTVVSRASLLTPLQLFSKIDSVAMAVDGHLSFLESTPASTSPATPSAGPSRLVLEDGEVTQFSWQMQTKRNPLPSLLALNNVPGVAIRYIKFDFSQKGWQVHGDAYAK